MKKRFHQVMSLLLVLSLLFSLNATTVVASENSGPSSIYEMLPAPGQFVNEAGWGGTGDLGKAWNNANLNSGVSLGSFGGSIIFKFDEPVRNDPQNPYGVDFTVYGNAFNGNEEPAGVAVAQDDGTGKPGTWYYIAGSEHYEDSTVWDYQVTYTNPEPDFTTPKGVNIPWSDNHGGSGAVRTNGSHQHAYYPIPANYPLAPVGFNNESATYAGVKIDVRKNAFGYPDTHANGSAPYDVPSNPYGTGASKGDPIDISWAVDRDGKPVQLDRVDYVRVYTAVQIDAGMFGEVSPEVTGIYKATPNPDTAKTDDLSSIVLKGVGDGAAELEVPLHAGVYRYEDLVVDANEIKLTAIGTAENVYVNNVRGTGGQEVNKVIPLREDQPRLVRVIAQDGIHTPKIYTLSIKKGVEAPEVNKAELLSKIAEAEAIKKGNHTEESWGVLQERLTQSKQISTSQTATQAQVNTALANLVEAIQGLKTNTPIPQTINVSLTVNGVSVTANKSVVVPTTSVNVEVGKTVAEVFDKVMTDKGIPYVNYGGNYIAKIGDLAELDGGDRSGWLYKVNGVYPDVGVADYVLSNGDSILFRYTDDYKIEFPDPTENPVDPGTPSTPGNDTPSVPAQVIKELERVGLSVENRQPIEGVARTTSILNRAEIMSEAQAELLKKELSAHLVALRQTTASKAETAIKDRTDEVWFILPSGGLKDDVTIGIEELASDRKGLVSGLYEFTPNGTKFDKPAYISIKIPVLAASLDRLALVWLDEKTNRWIPVPAVLDAKTGVITGKVAHFTKYAVIDRSKLNGEQSQFKSVDAEIRAAAEQIRGGGTLSDWEAFALARAGQKVPSDYLLRVEELLKQQSGEFRKVTDYERIALAVKAAGGDPTRIAGYNLIEKIYNHEKMLNQGLNGPVFALLTLDSGQYDVPAGARWNRDLLIDWILQQQSANGGFALTSGEADNVDMTAMAISALAPHQDRPAVKSAIDNALNWLSKTQLPSGGYQVFGDANSESVSQVIIALSTLGVPFDQAGFVKAEGDLLTNLLRFRNADGGFAHVLGQPSNEMATEQALMALVAYDRMSKQQAGLYQLVDGIQKEKFIDEDQIASWAFDSVYRAFATKVMIGVDTTELRFAPKQQMTRAQFATLLVKLIGEAPASSADRTFLDVQPNSWYYGYVMKAKSLGIVHGVAPNAFHPDQAITREEMAIMIGKAYQLAPTSSNYTYRDQHKMNQAAIPLITAVQERGIMVGYDDYFEPRANVTREMAAVVAVKLQQLAK